MKILTLLSGLDIIVHRIIHKYLEDQENLGTVRIGLSQYTSMDDIDKLYNAIIDIVGEV